MHVGLVIYGSLSTVSGGFFYNQQLLDHLHQQGDTFDIISLPWHTYPRALTHNWSAAISRKFASKKFDILIQDELCHPSLFHLNSHLKAQHPHTPLISLIHLLRQTEKHPPLLRHLYQYIEQKYLNSVDAFIYNSRTTQQTVQNLTPPRPHIVAYPAANHLNSQITLDQITQRAHEGQKLRILYVGNLIPRKNLHPLLLALAQLPRDTWHLTIIGSLSFDKTYVNHITRTINQLRLAPNIDLLGIQQGASLQEQYAQHHLFVMPSHYESFGMVYLEAMGFGLPAIATQAGAAPELITHGETGYLLSPHLPTMITQLTTHIQQLHHNRSLLAQLGHNARQHYQQFPTWTDSMSKIRHFLHQIKNL